ncbi:hypothetical protein [Clostridium brassicae]|uniref:Uncharacterized protein n=1 Tax=Clostridium brassicae TaxID=2999072 RepID=A0ABT4D8T1_9CLOT|nr:hypothetical protein [Clostridium brassicae]MCY6958685.1 hypothetical protein [Clostridium brassicae]
MHKKIFVSVLALLIGFGLYCMKPTYAMATEKIPFTAEYIQQLNDDDFINTVIRYAVDKENEGVEFKDVQEALNTVGVKVTKSESLLKGSSDVKHTVYITHRAGQSYYYLTAGVTANRKLSDPGGEDAISIEWEASKASYYSTTEGQYTTYMDGTNRLKGIVMFNLDDSKLNAADKYAYCSVRVVPKVSGKWIEVGSKYVHTYSVTNYSWTLGSTFNYSSTGPAGGLSYSVTGTPASSSWQTYADNAFKA